MLPGSIPDLTTTELAIATFHQNDFSGAISGLDLQDRCADNPKFALLGESRRKLKKRKIYTLKIHFKMVKILRSSNWEFWLSGNTRLQNPMVRNCCDIKSTNLELRFHGLSCGTVKNDLSHRVITCALVSQKHAHESRFTKLSAVAQSFGDGR